MKTLFIIFLTVTESLYENSFYLGTENFKKLIISQLFYVIMKNNGFYIIMKRLNSNITVVLY